MHALARDLAPENLGRYRIKLWDLIANSVLCLIFIVA